MSMPETKPLLTICIPTYNRASFLNVMLQALLPQVSNHAAEVEVWILDNASTDETSKIINDFKDNFTFNIIKQDTNVGPTRNIIVGPTKYANGDFVWILGDHNLLLPNALSKILSVLRKREKYKSYYVNFRAASYPIHWPTSAVSGHDGPYDYYGNDLPQIDSQTTWSELISARNAICTQNYVHIIRTSIWHEFWNNRTIKEDYSNAITTFPHTVTVLQMLFEQPVYVIAEPCLTIFNGAQSWSNPETRTKVFFVGFPDLLHLLETKASNQESIKLLWKNFFLPETVRVVRETISQQGKLRGTFLICKHLGFESKSWLAFGIGLSLEVAPNTFRRINYAATIIKNYRSSYFFNCRPARFLRRILCYLMKKTRFRNPTPPKT